MPETNLSEKVALEEELSPKTGKPKRKGNYKAGPGRGHKKPPPERQESDFDRLKAMRHVLTNPPVTDQSEGEKACRAWLEKSPGPFMETYDRLEAEAKKAERGKDAEDEEEALESEESDEELAEQINELLAKHLPRKK